MYVMFSWRNFMKQILQRQYNQMRRLMPIQSHTNFRTSASTIPIEETLVHVPETSTPRDEVLTPKSFMNTVNKKIYENISRV